MTLILENSYTNAPLEALRDDCDRNPNSKLFMPLAEQLRRRGSYGEAIDVCMRAKAAHPRYVSCRVLLGRCFLELGMREEARRELERVLELDRENVFSLRVMAELLRAQGDLRQAVNYYRALLRVSPTDVDARQRLTELAQLLEISKDNGLTPSPSNSLRQEKESTHGPIRQDSPVENDFSASPSAAAYNSRGQTRVSRELFKREIKRSDFSKFAEWVSSRWQDSASQQGGALPGGRE